MVYMFPLPIEDGDGCPVRAVAMEDELRGFAPIGMLE